MNGVRVRPRAFTCMGVVAVFWSLQQIFLTSEILNRTLLMRQETQRSIPTRRVNSLEVEDKMTQLLRDAGITVDESDKLPRWVDVTKLYGSEPIIHGRETCEQFRKEVSITNRWLGVAGLFNSGTNLLSDYMQKTCLLPARNGAIRRNLWQVPWGKHMLPSRRHNNTVHTYEKYNKTDTIPIVIIRDPYNWQQSMCNHTYAIYWKHSRERCPNLIERGTPIPAKIRYTKSMTDEFPSLAHIWSEYYSQYLKADYPRLIVRYEDMLFHPKRIMKQVCDCVEGQFVEKEFSLKVDNAKFGPGHGVQKADQGLLNSLKKNTDTSRRVNGLTREDLVYAATAFDTDLTTLFHYASPEIE